MIRLKQPSVALHSCDVPGYKYEMETTIYLNQGMWASDIIPLITWARDAAKGKFLHNVVFNSHGSPGKLWLGGDGQMTTDVLDMSHFAPLKGSIGRVWIVACNVAEGAGFNIESEGGVFCSSLARTLGCDVIASEKEQHVNAFVQIAQPKNCIDRFEGKTYVFSADGKRQRFNPQMRKI